MNEIEKALSAKLTSNLCPCCFGTGKVKAMQLAAYINGGSIRAKDEKIKCPKCNGKGRIERS